MSCLFLFDVLLFYAFYCSIHCAAQCQFLQQSQQLQQQFIHYGQQYLVGSTRCRRQADTSCENCLTMQLQGGVHPTGAISSTSGLAVTPTPIHRGDRTFWRFDPLVQMCIKLKCMFGSI